MRDSRLYRVLALLRYPRAALWIATGTCAILAAGLAAWSLRPGPAPAPSSPAARQYLNQSACLLTSPSGVVPGSPAAPLWASMQSASLATHVMVSYLPDTGPSDVVPMINTMVERRCGVIITASADLGQVLKTVRANPGQRFLLVATSASATSVPRNAVVVRPANAPSQINQAIRALAAAA